MFKNRVLPRVPLGPESLLLEPGELPPVVHRGHRLPHEDDDYADPDNDPDQPEDDEEDVRGWRAVLGPLDLNLQHPVSL